MTDAERFQWLATLKCNSLSLERDEHACNYVTAREWIEEYEPDWFKDTPPDEVILMKATNTIWRLQIYPVTPIGFNVWFGSTAAAVIDAAMAEYASEQK